MPTSITRECSNSVLHLGQIRIQVGIRHLERVTAKKLESIHTVDATVPIERLKNNRVLCVPELRALSRSCSYLQQKYRKGFPLKPPPIRRILPAESSSVKAFRPTVREGTVAA